MKRPHVMPQTDTDATHAADECEEELVFRPYGVGIDCHSKFIQVCVRVRNPAGGVSRYDGTYGTGIDSLREGRRFAVSRLTTQVDAAAALDAEGLRYTIESTACYHMPVIAVFGGVPSVANPLLASPTRRKTDVLDAKLLAYHALTGLWPVSYLPGTPVQVLRVLLNMRDDAKRTSTRCANRVNNFLLRFGHTFGAVEGVRGATGRAMVEDMAAGAVPGHPGVAEAGIPEACRPVFKELYAQFDAAAARAKEYEAKCFAHLQSCDFVLGTGEVVNGKALSDLLSTIPGFGPMTRLYWAAEVCTPTRFPNAKALVAFAGCDPSLKVSAGKVTSVTRRGGNQKLHSTLCHAAGTLILHATGPYGAWGNRLWHTRKRGGFKTACGAVARRLAEASYHVTNRGEPFDATKYSFYAAPQVPNGIPLDGLVERRYAPLLSQYGTLSRLAEAYHDGSLGATKGVGEKCMNHVKALIASAVSSEIPANGALRLRGVVVGRVARVVGDRPLFDYTVNAGSGMYTVSEFDSSSRPIGSVLDEPVTIRCFVTKRGSAVAALTVAAALSAE